MSGINKVIILGRLGQDPEARALPSGGSVTNISVATSESWKDKNTGEKKEKTEWHRVTFFGKIAEVAAQYLKKGSQIYVEGALKTSKYEKDGQTHYSTDIVVQGFGGVMQMLDSKSDNGASTASYTPQQQATQQPELDDDIPF